MWTYDAEDLRGGGGGFLGGSRAPPPPHPPHPQRTGQFCLFVCLFVCFTFAKAHGGGGGGRGLSDALQGHTGVVVFARNRNVVLLKRHDKLGVVDVAVVI